MCGIAAVIRPEASDARIASDLERMRPGIASRGPDGHGSLHSGGVGLLNTRLAVIDLQTGDQPVWNETGDVACVFNGEIYNYRALRAELSRAGHTFVTTTDTEVLVHLYEDEGPRMVDHLHGMYAFAVFDKREQQVLLGRDRLGMKPLYQASLPGGTAFASSIGSLLALGVSSDPDEAAIAEYLRFYKIPEPRTACRAITAVLPGSTVSLDIQTGESRTRRFFRPGGDPPTTDNVRTAVEAVAEARQCFERAVASHLVADVEVGAFLSGGVDSSLVVAEAQRQSSRPLRTYSFSFRDDDGYDETPFAEEVARRLGTRHETLELTSSAEELVRRGIAAAQQPFAVASFLPLLELSERAARDVKVVLSGDGGDELGFGYPWYGWCRRASRLPSTLEGGRVGGFLRMSEMWASTYPGLRHLRRAAKFSRGALLPAAGASDAWRYDLTQSDSISLLAPEHRSTANGRLLLSPTEAVWRSEVPDVEALRLADIEVLLRDEMLPKLDRAGMAHGLEARVPLLDDDFVDAMLSVPTDQHLSHRGGKALLRRWAKDLVPGVDFDRPKHGFDVPIHRWLDGPLSADVDRLLLRPARPSLLHPPAARAVLQRMRAGVPGAGHTLYAMLVAALWLEEPGGLT